MNMCKDNIYIIHKSSIYIYMHVYSIHIVIFIYIYIALVEKTYIHTCTHYTFKIIEFDGQRTHPGTLESISRTPCSVAIP